MADIILDVVAKEIKLVKAVTSRYWQSRFSAAINAVTMVNGQWPLTRTYFNH